VEHSFDAAIGNDPRDRHALAMRDDPRAVVTDPHASYFGTGLGERTLLPGVDAILGEIATATGRGRTAFGK
jgi:hypothetical protein